MNLLIAGDFCPQNRVAEIFDSHEYHMVLGEVKEIVNSADYSIVNFECPVTKGGEQAIPKQGPNLQCSVHGFHAIRWAGFDCVTLANNHFLDYGREGVENTLNECIINNIDSVGGGLTLKDASKTLYKNILGETVAIINCCEHEFSIATDSTAGSNPLNPIRQYYAIKEAKEKADYVLVIVHGGHEHFQLPSTRMQETYRFFVDAGADAIVNHHQHCYSGFEIYKEKPIFYGLGNFCFDGNRSRKDIWYEGYMVSINFKPQSIHFKIYPYRQCAETPTVSILDDKAYDKSLEVLNTIINNPVSLNNAITAYYSENEFAISNVFEPLNNRFFIAAKRRGWLPSLISIKRKIAYSNFILCESHRDKLSYWLNPQK